MIRHLSNEPPEVTEHEWAGFPGGELEGKRPKTLCRSCRERLKRIALGGRLPAGAPGARPPRTLCFQCYRAELDRERALKAAGNLDTASTERFQSALPFEPVNVSRLDRLRAERAAARVTREGAGQLADRRRRAQIAARHALQEIAAGLRARPASARPSLEERRSEQDRVVASAVHAAELQLPESWLPFVVSR
jgi:hypothetical protein